MNKYLDPDYVFGAEDYDDLFTDFENLYWESRDFYKDGVSEGLHRVAQVMLKYASALSIEQNKLMADFVLKKIPGNPPIMTLFLYSLVLELAPCAEVVEEALDFILENAGYFTKNNLYFYAYRIMSVTFRRKDAENAATRVKLWELFNIIYRRFESEVSTSLEPIPFEQRNKDLVIVFTEQMVTIKHGPTKTALDRCKAIITKMNKNVLLICTNEMLSEAGSLPYAIYMNANSNDYKDAEEIEWKGVKIPFFNIDETMPSIRVIDEMLALIRRLAPYRIVSIGAKGVLANLADRIIPSVGIGLCPSATEPTSMTFQTLGKPMDAADRELLSAMKLPESHVIESVFTSSLKPQQGKFTRGELGIPEDAFVITVIGGRLGFEVTEEFLEMLEGVMEDDYFILFLGIFDGYENKLRSHKKIEKAYKCMAVDDILAVLELCDLYVNPIRRGGGTSCVEAMYKGVPVVSTAYGDVAVNCGPDFCVEDYDKMGKTIRRYHDDIDFYTDMSQKVKTRTEVLLDTEGEFVRIMNEADMRERQNRE